MSGCELPGCAPTASSEPAVPAPCCWQSEFHCLEPKGIILSPSLTPQMGPRQPWAEGYGPFCVCPCVFCHPWALPSTITPCPTLLFLEKDSDTCSSTGQGHPPALLLPEPALPDPPSTPKEFSSLKATVTALAKTRGTFLHLSALFQAGVQTPPA